MLAPIQFLYSINVYCVFYILMIIFSVILIIMIRIFIISMSVETARFHTLWLISTFLKHICAKLVLKYTPLLDYLSETSEIA